VGAIWKLAVVDRMSYRDIAEQFESPSTVAQRHAPDAGAVKAGTAKDRARQHAV
jgi:hypothetical protein